MAPRNDHELRIADFLPCSEVNGPGRRAVVWVQGCSLGCPGCFNPHTHSKGGGRTIAIEVLAQRILA
ncbi:MAG: 4Fe-4S cluster-binding domain-containing protein, partial [Deltaproteobacteria bacterium]